MAGKDYHQLIYCGDKYIEVSYIKCKMILYNYIVIFKGFSKIRLRHLFCMLNIN